MADMSTIFVVSSKASQRKQPLGAQFDLLFSHCMTFSILKKKRIRSYLEYNFWIVFLDFTMLSSLLIFFFNLTLFVLRAVYCK